MAQRAETKTEIDLLVSIDERLRQLLTLTALGYTAGKKQTVAIEDLARANISAKAISEITGWPGTTVAPVVSKLKGKNKKKKS
jgi:hypothetical protein